MNSPQAKLRRVRAEEEARAGPSLKKLKTDLLKKVITKTIVKEQHAESVRKLEFDHLPNGGKNLFATVGGDFATVYDDAHFGDHVAVVLQARAIHWSPYDRVGVVNADP
jgi:hypothetical protein